MLVGLQSGLVNQLQGILPAVFAFKPVDMDFKQSRNLD
jgi:hypothetical protein